MRSNYFLALMAAASVASIANIGCDGNTNTGEGGGGAGGDSSSTTTTTTPMMTTTTTTTTTTTGVVMDPSVDCATAEPLELNTQGGGTGDLYDPLADTDYFSFTGTAGQRMVFYVDAKPDDDAFNAEYIDTVITLFGPNGQQFAANDDPIPRLTQDSELFTVLPADGTYCLKIEDFCGFSGQCDGADITTTTYSITAGELNDAATTVEVEGPEGMDNTITKYPLSTNEGAHVLTLIAGSFADGTDEDVYTFTIPDDLTIAGGRTTTHVEVFPVGPDGNGSSAPTGDVWIEDSGGNILAMVNGTLLDAIDGYPIEMPYDPGKTYSLHVKAGTPFNASNSFYYMYRYDIGSNDVETESAGSGSNDTLMTAEDVAEAMSQGGFAGGFFAGDLDSATDEDWFHLLAKPGAGQVVVGTCWSERIGSGVRDLKLEVVNADTGAVIPTANGTETNIAPASLPDMGADLAGATNIAVHITAGTPDANVKGTYYKCGVVFVDPA